MLYANGISFFVTSKCQKSEQLMKILNIEEKNLQIEELRNFNEVFRKDVPYDNIKSHKKAGLHPLPKNYNFGKITSMGPKLPN